MANLSTVDGKTTADAYLNRMSVGSGSRAALVKKNGKYQEVTWQEIHRQVIGVFNSYQKLGIKKGDRVCILSQSRIEWNIVDIANLCCGVITVPIYHSNIADDVAFIINHCGAKLVFFEDEVQGLKLDESFKSLKINLPTVCFEPLTNKIPGLEVTPFSEFSAAPTDNNVDETFRKLAKAVTPEDVATIVYTSGTTGRPKGVVLSHSNIAGELRAIVQGFELSLDDMCLTFLPFAHILARVESLMPIYSGITLAYAENINSVPQNIQEVKPTILVSVPRIYEKIYSKIQNEIANQPAFTQKIFKWASTIGRQVARLRSEQKSVPLPLAMKYKIADQLVFHKVREKLGGRIRLTVSGGAPLNAELCEFFHACGIKIVEGYGLTETTAAITVNRPNDFSFGSVGKTLGGTEIRIAPDGEILVRGALVFKEYYNNPEGTREVFTNDGWFCTGDIGEITARGFLKITDRKKELIVTSAGKNIAPQKLENLLKNTRFISQAIVFGDKQKYITALLTLNEPEIEKWAKSQGLAFSNFAELTKEPRIVSMIEADVHQVNGQLPSFETVKKFKILPKDLTIEAGELTPSLKVKRKVCAQKFKSEVDAMYS